MLWYAETSARRTRQVLADAAVAAWALLWWWVSRVTHDLVAALGAPGERLATSSERLAGGFDRAADAGARVPLVGDALRAPFVELASAVTTIGDVGRAQDAAAAALASWLAAIVLVLPLVLVAGPWLVVRVRGARRADAARRMRDEDTLDLLALRALVTQPVARLRATSPDPAQAWRDGDIAELAALELRRLGLRGTS